jgi:cell division protein FtsQ
MMRSSSLKHSEIVRQRRTQASTAIKQHTPKLVSRQQATAAHSTPPVLVRGDMASVPMAARPRTNRTRRRYEVRTKLPDVRLLLPSLPAIKFGARALSAPMTGTLILVIYFLWTSPFYQVISPKINGLKYIPKQEFTRVLDMTGKPIFAVDIEDTEKKLQDTFKELASVDVQVTLPAMVTVTVKERQPVLVWKQEGRTIWVDAEGIGFPFRGEESSMVVISANSDPLSTSSNPISPEQFLPKKIVQAILTIHNLAPPETQLVYDTQHGLGWQDPRGWQVYFGTDLEDIQEKLSIYQAIVSHVSQEGIQPVLISVEYLQAPFYRLEP